MDEKHEAIRNRAYAIWREEGEPHGRDADHWNRAEREIGGSPAPAEDEPMTTALDTSAQAGPLDPPAAVKAPRKRTPKPR